MQSEVESLRADNNVLKRANEMLQFENDQLSKALDKAKTERDHHMVKRGELKALLDGAGNFLVAGIRKYHDAIVQEQAVQELPIPPLRLADKAAE
jgi:regulator of replication initiation timing